MAVIQTAAQAMGLGHALFSRLPHMHLLSLPWCLIQMSHAEALALKSKTYQCVPLVSYIYFEVMFLPLQRVSATLCYQLIT